MSQPLRITTLGSFGISAGTTPIVPNWPEGSARQLFCTLLSPLDESVPWERLSRSLTGKPGSPESIELLRDDVEKVIELFQTTTGYTPIKVNTDGVGIDVRVVTLDSHHFRECALSGLALMAQGDLLGMHQAFRQARSWYGGHFLPGFHGRIINDTRTELAELFGMTTLKRGVPRAAVVARQTGSRFPRYLPVVRLEVAP
jgi:hypothetical protein